MHNDSNKYNVRKKSKRGLKRENASTKKRGKLNSSSLKSRIVDHFANVTMTTGDVDPLSQQRKNAVILRNARRNGIKIHPGGVEVHTVLLQ